MDYLCGGGTVFPLHPSPGLKGCLLHSLHGLHVWSWWVAVQFLRDFGCKSSVEGSVLFEAWVALRCGNWRAHCSMLTTATNHRGLAGPRACLLLPVWALPFHVTAPHRSLHSLSLGMDMWWLLGNTARDDICLFVFSDPRKVIIA